MYTRIPNQSNILKVQVQNFVIKTNKQDILLEKDETVSIYEAGYTRKVQFD